MPTVFKVVVTASPTPSARAGAGHIAAAAMMPSAITSGRTIAVATPMAFTHITSWRAAHGWRSVGEVNRRCVVTEVIRHSLGSRTSAHRTHFTLVTVGYNCHVYNTIRSRFALYAFPFRALNDSDATLTRFRQPECRPLRSDRGNRAGAYG